MNLSNKNQSISNETIYKILQWLTISVSTLFLIINIARKNTVAMCVIGMCILVFCGMNIFLKKMNVSLYKREFAASFALSTLVFMISLFSGASYSDDFPMMLAVIGLCGMFLEPKLTLIQIMLTAFYFILMYFINPEKAGAASQYILCYACFVLAACLYYQVIKRGRSFIEKSELKAKESDGLLESIREMGTELQEDFESSSKKIEIKTMDLQQDSASIAQSAGVVVDSCNDAHNKIVETREQLSQLDDGVKQFETILVENRKNVETMDEQVKAVGTVISESGELFLTLGGQMQEIAGIAKQITNIAFQLTILSLNASVESAHAGQFGAGFEVVASEIRSLAETSGKFSDKVTDAVKDLLEKVEVVAGRVEDSKEAFLNSEQVMKELSDSFGKLNDQFSKLYGNIEGQSQNVNQIDYIFSDLENKVSDMYDNSLSNQKAVEGIAEAMVEFSDNVGKIVRNTQSV